MMWIEDRPGRSYSVEDREHGMVIWGPVPLDDTFHLFEMAKERGYHDIAVGMSNALGVVERRRPSFVFVSAESLRLWKAEIAEQDVRLDPVERWLRSDDTGYGALSIVYALCPEYRQLLAPVFQPKEGRTPRDPSDFGRCYRLLEVAPDLRARLGEVAQTFSCWSLFARDWDALVELWEAEEKSGTCEQLYERMQELTRKTEEHQERLVKLRTICSCGHTLSGHGAGLACRLYGTEPDLDRSPTGCWRCDCKTFVRPIGPDEEE